MCIHRDLVINGEVIVRIRRKQNGKYQLKNISNTDFHISGYWCIAQVTKNFIEKLNEKRDITCLITKGTFSLKAGETRNILPHNYKALMKNIYIHHSEVIVKEYYFDILYSVYSSKSTLESSIVEDYKMEYARFLADTKSKAQTTFKQLILY